MFKLFTNFFKKPSKKQSKKEQPKEQFLNLNTITFGKSIQKYNWICVEISLSNEKKHTKYAKLSLGFPNTTLTKEEHADLKKIITNKLNKDDIKILGKEYQSYSECFSKQGNFGLDFTFDSPVRILCKIDTNNKIVSYRYNNEDKKEIDLKTPIELKSNEDKKVENKNQIKI
ncbi:MAG: hypothetical protein PVI75_08010 [Gammaproteobacteria bacterium]|jgi:hypothetical protein